MHEQMRGGSASGEPLYPWTRSWDRSKEGFQYILKKTQYFKKRGKMEAWQRTFLIIYR